MDNIDFDAYEYALSQISEQAKEIYTSYRLNRTDGNLYADEFFRYVIENEDSQTLENNLADFTLIYLSQGFSELVRNRETENTLKEFLEYVSVCYENNSSLEYIYENREEI